MASSTAYTASTTDYTAPANSASTGSPIIAPPTTTQPTTVVLSPEQQRQQMVASSQQRIQEAAAKRKQALQDALGAMQQAQAQQAQAGMIGGGDAGMAPMQMDPNAQAAAIVRALQNNAMGV